MTRKKEADSNLRLSNGTQEAGSEGLQGKGDCLCEYQILDGNVTLGFGSGHARQSLYTTDVIGQISCSGTESCYGGVCEYFFADIADPASCSLCTSNCIDNIYDDGSGASFPTPFYPFNCQMQADEQFRLFWRAFFAPFGDCSGNGLSGGVGNGTFITVRLRCQDRTVELGSDCKGWGYYSPPITLTLESGGFEVNTQLKLGLPGGCGCEPHEL